MKIILCVFALMTTLSGVAQQKTYPSSFKVAQDGSGDFKTIQEAVNAVRDFSDQEVSIFIKNGTYNEKLVIPSWKIRVKLIGESKDLTIISYGDYSGKEGLTTFTSFTVLVQGNDFKAENITFQNSAGPLGQAVALHVTGDRCMVSNCRILGNQDTLLPATDSSRQYYTNCYIEGTTDFIFGAATVVFERCHIHSKKNSYITAASTSTKQKFGFVFMDCKLTADSGVNKVFLGRPWRPYANTVFIYTEMAAHILPEGWDNWRNPENEKTAFYAEYRSRGPGGKIQQRVKWAKQLKSKERKEYTLKNILGGKDNWDPQAEPKK